MTIKELRKEKGLTLAEFAKALGIGLSTLTGYEAGKRNPSEKVVAKIREVYGVDLADGAAPVQASKQEKKASGKRATAEKAAPAKKAARKKKAGEPQIIIQSPLGGEITPFAILARVGQVDKVYIRVDLNKAFWVKGDEHGDVDLW